MVIGISVTFAQTPNFRFVHTSSVDELAQTARDSNFHSTYKSTTSSKRKKVDRLKATGGSANQFPKSIVLINQSEANKE